jgi:hypothetical protein
MYVRMYAWMHIRKYVYGECTILKCIQNNNHLQDLNIMTLLRFFVTLESVSLLLLDFRSYHLSRCEYGVFSSRLFVLFQTLPHAEIAQSVQRQAASPKSWGVIPGRSKRPFTSPCRPDWLCGPTNLISNGYRGLFPRGKAARA